MDSSNDDDVHITIETINVIPRVNRTVEVSWTFTIEPEFVSIYSHNVGESILTLMAEEMAMEIDREIIHSLGLSFHEDRFCDIYDKDSLQLYKNRMLEERYKFR